MSDTAAVTAHAALLWEQGRHGEAIDAFAALAAQHPTNPDIALRLGIALIQVQRLVDAVHAMEPAETTAPPDHALHDWLARALAAALWQQRGPAALDPLRARLAEAPDDLSATPHWPSRCCLAVIWPRDGRIMPGAGGGWRVRTGCRPIRWCVRIRRTGVAGGFCCSPNRGWAIHSSSCAMCRW